jgi:two-component system, NarL family, response regulator NreC
LQRKTERYVRVGVFAAAQPSGVAGIRIVVADDHVVVRTGLRLWLQRSEGMDVVAEVGDTGAAVQAVLDHEPDVLVLDLNMPGERGSAETIERVRSISPATRIVVLTMEDEPSLVRRVLGCGAAGYVLKESERDDLVEAVRRVVAGKTYLSAQLGVALALAPDAPQRPGGLSEREVEVLRLLALGHTNKEIAERLHVSTRTVEAHRASLQHKLSRATRAELVRYALDRGLLDERA